MAQQTKSKKVNRSKTTTKKRKLSNSHINNIPKLQTNSLTHLPILTKTGESVFEVGARFDDNNNTPKVGVIPVFSLPSVSFDSAFVNRIPRESNPNEILARQKEKEEVLRMQEQLGLTEADLMDLEAELGMQNANERQSENEVDKFIKRQLHAAATTEVDGGGGNSISISNSNSNSNSNININSKRRRQGDDISQDYLLDRPTPRCLGLGVKSDAR